MGAMPCPMQKLHGSWHRGPALLLRPHAGAGGGICTLEETERDVCSELQRMLPFFWSLKPTRRLLKLSSQAVEHL